MTFCLRFFVVLSLCVSLSVAAETEFEAKGYASFRVLSSEYYIAGLYIDKQSISPGLFGADKKKRMQY